MVNGLLLNTRQRLVKISTYQGNREGFSEIDILIENMGRVNYGHKFLADTQRKGIRTGVCKDLHFLLNWKQYPLPLDNPEKIDFSKGWTEGQPAFYAFDFTVEEPKDTYLDLSDFGKGVAFVNGRHLGRFWNVGPTSHFISLIAISRRVLTASSSLKLRANIKKRFI